MPWLQCLIPASAADAPILETALESSGAQAITLTDGADQPLYEPPPGATPLWRETVLTALFNPEEKPESILAAITQALGQPPADYHFEWLEDQPWERAWMKDFHPMRFGQRLWIIPSWCSAPEPDAINLQLDPGLAFGTGTHDTTALCLEWLDAEPLKGKSVIDYGCGSGVLGIAALLLGARHVIACDIDPQALEATTINATGNGVKQHLSCHLPDALDDNHQCDVLIANILAGPILDLAEDFIRLCRPKGRMALSGILQEQAEGILQKFSSDFDLDPLACQGDWCRISGTRID